MSRSTMASPITGSSKQFKPSLGLDLGSDDERSLVVALFENVHQRGGLLVGVVS